MLLFSSMRAPKWYLESSLKRLGALLGGSWGLLGRSWSALGRSYSALGAENTPTRAQDPPIKPEQVVGPEGTVLSICLRPVTICLHPCNHLLTSV